MAGSSEETTIAVPARGSVEHAVDVKGGLVTAWSVSVNNDFDVNCSISYDEGTGRVVVSPSSRCQVDTGSYTPQQDGKLIFIFDNSFSLLRSKTVVLSIASGYDNTDVLARDAILANAHVMKGIELFFTNRFEEAEAFFAVHKDKVPIHNLSWATLCFFRGLMSWDPEILMEATARVKGTQDQAAGWMPKEGVFSTLKGMVSLGGSSRGAGDSPASPQAGTATGGGGGGTPYVPESPSASSGSGALAGGSLTPNQLEGTLVYAESSMLIALLSLMEESLMALVRCGLSIRSGWRVYQSADKALNGAVSRIKGESPQMQVLLGDLQRAAALFPRPAGAAAEGALTGSASSSAGAGTPAAMIAPAHGHVLGGVEYGMGAFNCLASILPPIVLRVIAVLGFPSDRASGMSQLRASLLAGGVSGPLAALFLLAMRVLLPSFHSGDVAEHVPEAEAVLRLMLDRYPDSAMFLWLAGRLARMQGDAERSAQLLQRCQNIRAWPQLTHLCEYELGW